MFKLDGASARLKVVGDQIFFDGNPLRSIEAITYMINCANDAFMAVEYFCEQVEEGNFRSVRTYHSFNDILIKSGWRKDEA